MTDAGRRLWARANAEQARARDEGTVGSHTTATAADRMFTQLRLGLGRWIGADGYRALVGRALVIARTEHPALAGLTCVGDDEAAIAAAVDQHGAAAVSSGIVALATVVTELLGRIVGLEMAVRLVEQTSFAGPDTITSTKAEGGRNG